MKRKGKTGGAAEDWACRRPGMRRKIRKEKEMVKHVILWQLKDEFSEEEKQKIRQGIREGLEGLRGEIPGLVDIHVQVEYLPSSTADVMLDSTFTDEEALKAYSQNPKHVKVADERVRHFTKSRACMDYHCPDGAGR